MLKSLSAPKLIELRQLVRQIVLEQGRKVVVFSQWRRMLTLAHWAVSDLLERRRSARRLFHRGRGTAAADPEHRRVSRRSRLSHPLHQRCRRRRLEPPARGQLRDQSRASLEPGRARAADRPHLPPGPEAADRRLQPRLRAGHRIADRRPGRLEAGVFQGALRRRQRHGRLRAVFQLSWPRFKSCTSRPRSRPSHRRATWPTKMPIVADSHPSTTRLPTRSTR